MVVVDSFSVMLSLTVVDSVFALFLTLKYTVLVPLPELKVKLGDVEYVCQLALLNEDDSLAM